MPKTNNNSYDADDITVLSDLDGVREWIDRFTLIKYS